jgi:hypothetical protein
MEFTGKRRNLEWSHQGNATSVWLSQDGIYSDAGLPKNGILSLDDATSIKLPPGGIYREEKESTEEPTR